MKNERAWLSLILMVSCAHALSHTFELALPSVEMQVAASYGVDKHVTGWLATAWRLPWGLGALLAGWLVDRWGERRMLTVYLLGCGIACLIAALPLPLPALFVVMFGMGACACIYHPAGLALLSHETTTANRPRALSFHGIFGSAGISAAPFLAAAVLSWGWSWRQYYLLLSLPGLLLGSVFLRQCLRRRAGQQLPTAIRAPDPDDDPRLSNFLTLCGLAVLQGFCYAGTLSFLPRYLSDWEGPLSGWPPESRGALATGTVLVVGCVGQYLAGRWARPESLEKQLAWVTLANVPFLAAMTVATGGQRLLAAAGFALFHFMHQPIYNSLIARYSLPQRRSMAYGFSFAMGLGVGSFGATFAGYSPNPRVTYGVFVVTAVMAASLAWGLWLRRRIDRVDTPKL